MQLWRPQWRLNPDCDLANHSEHFGAEQSLEPYETCCLAEVFLPNITSKEELLDVLEYAYRINKHSLALKAHHKETERVVHKNMRMGIGMTGVLQCTEEQRSWLPEAYEYLRAFDVEYSADNDMPVSIKLTTVKPSGTLSLLPGVTPGIHPAYSRYMLRRIRISSSHPLVATCREHGYEIEYMRNFDGSYDYGTVVVSFPFAYPDSVKLACEMSAIDQLEEIRRMQREWSDNSVSCTVYYKQEELPEIKRYLKENYRDCFKSLSFLLHSNHGFDQAPLEEISKEVYEELVKNTRTIERVEYASFESDDECSSGACPVK